MKYELTDSAYFNGYTISTDKEKGYKCITQILSRFDILMQKMLNAHCKVFFMSMVIRYDRQHCYPENNDLFEEFISYYSYIFNHEYKYNMKYCWIREQNAPHSSAHFHLALLFNGSNIQHVKTPVEVAERLWDMRLGYPGIKGLIHCDPNIHSTMIRKGSENYFSAIDNCFKTFSYMSKSTSKNHTPQGVRLYGSSISPAKKTTELFALPI